MAQFGTFNPRNYTLTPQSEAKGEHKLADIATVRPNPWNYNVQGEETFTKLAESLRRFGFVQPVIVRQAKDGRLEIINGEHRWRAAQIVGMKQIPVIDLGAIDDDRAKQLSVILNELGGSPDQVKLAELLRDIDVPFEDLSAVMPYTEREMKMFLEAMDFSFDNLSEGDARAPEQKKEDTKADENAGLDVADDSEEREDDDGLRKLVFKLTPEQAKLVRKVLKKLDNDLSAGLVKLAEAAAAELAEAEEAKPKPTKKEKAKEVVS